MDAREYLEEIRTQRARIDQLRAEIDRLRESINLLPGVTYDGDNVQTSTQDSAILTTVDELLDKERTLARMIKEHEEDVSARVSAILALDDEEQIAILYHRYVTGLYFWEIAREMKISESSVYRIHREALEEVEL